MTLAEYLSEQARTDWVATEEAEIRRAKGIVATQLGFTLIIERLELKPLGPRTVWQINIYLVEIDRRFIVYLEPPPVLVDKEWYAKEIVRQIREQLK